MRARVEDVRRYARQARLADVGVAGVARLRAATLAVTGGGLRAAVAARYLAGAGVGTLRVADDGAAREASAIDRGCRVVVDVASPPAESDVPDAPDAPDAPRPALRDPSAAAVLDGAWDALDGIRAVLAAPAKETRS